MKLEDLVLGEMYVSSTGEPAYFCGINKHGKPVFELINWEGVCPYTITIPEGYVSKGNNTYWCFTGLEQYFQELTKTETK